MKKYFIAILFAAISILSSAQCTVGFQAVTSPSGNVDFVSTSTINDSLDYPINYTWSFGDGSSGTGATLTHFYNNTNGIYSVCVTMQTANGCTSTFCDSVVFNPISQCQSSFDSLQTTTNTFSFTSTSLADSGNVIVSYLWDFGDSTTSSLQNPIHIYPSHGYYNVCLTIVTSGGCVNTSCGLIQVLPATLCQPNFISTLDSLSVPANSTFIFTDQSLPGINDSIIAWNWFFYGESPYIYSDLQNPAITFTNPGSHLVCLTINTFSGCASTYCDSIFINQITQCQANFYSYLDSITVPPISPYVFIDQSILANNDTIISWSWTFSGGNPSTSSLQNPSVVFANQGSYEACLTIVTSTGCTSTFCDSIYVTGGCQLSVNLNTQSPTTIGGNDGFIETSVAGGTPPYSYSWSNGQTTANIYNLSSGVYTLNIIDANSCNFTYSTQLYEPYDTLGGSIVDTLTTGIIDSCLNFVPDSFYIANVVIDSINNIATITWTFTNGGLTSSITVQYTYYYSGNNAVLLTLNCGAKTLVTYMSFINITASVGVSDNIEEKLEINVYPVPFNDKLNIVFNSKKSGIVSLNVIDVMGRDLVMKQFSVSSGDNNIELNTSEFHSGIYILNIESDGKVFHKQIVK
ncbi:MAG: PKD domain-containing protein [Bacteroidia bacterium]|nr:PKD domain-containing protein [Bacteroidia bacterium]